MTSLQLLETQRHLDFKILNIFYIWSFNKNVTFASFKIVITLTFITLTQSQNESEWNEAKYTHNAKINATENHFNFCLKLVT